MPNTQFFDFVVNLVKLGGLGIGALIFVLVFIILFRNQAVTPENADLRKRYLTLGSIFALVALFSTTLTDILKEPNSSAVKLGVTISPDFDEARLPPPKLRLLPSGAVIAPDSSVTLTDDSTLTIQIKGLVDSVQNLSKSSRELLATNQQLTSVLKKSSQAAKILANESTSTSPQQSAAINALPTLKPDELQKLRVSQDQLRQQLDSGNFAAAAHSSSNLKIIASATPGLRVDQ